MFAWCYLAIVELIRPASVYLNSERSDPGYSQGYEL